MGGPTSSIRPAGRRLPWPGSSVGATRLSAVLRDRADGSERVAELVRLVAAHAAAGSELAERLALGGGPRPDDVWLVEPLAAVGIGPAVDDVAARAPVPLRIVAAAEVPVTTRPAGAAAVPTLS